MAGRQFPRSGANGQGPPPRRFVLLKTDEGFVPRPVDTGVSDFDFAEVMSGLQEGDSVLVFSSSRAGADRQAFMNRMRNMSGFSGFGGTQSQSSGQQRPSGVR